MSISPPPIPQIRLYETLTLKIQGQGHGWGKRSISHSLPSIQPMHLLFAQWDTTWHWGWHWAWWRYQSKHFRRYWLFVQGIHWSPVNSPHKGQWCRALIFSLICTWVNGCVNNRKAGDLRYHHAHYDVMVMREIIPSTDLRSDRVIVCNSHEAINFT